MGFSLRSGGFDRLPQKAHPRLGRHRLSAAVAPWLPLAILGAACVAGGLSDRAAVAWAVTLVLLGEGFRFLGRYRPGAIAISFAVACYIPAASQPDPRGWGLCAWVLLLMAASMSHGARGPGILALAVLGAHMALILGVLHLGYTQAQDILFGLLRALALGATAFVCMHALLLRPPQRALAMGLRMAAAVMLLLSVFGQRVLPW